MLNANVMFMYKICGSSLSDNEPCNVSRNVDIKKGSHTLIRNTGSHNVHIKHVIS